jgi:hypothetical protein
VGGRDRDISPRVSTALGSGVSARRPNALLIHCERLRVVVTAARAVSPMLGGACRWRAVEEMLARPGRSLTACASAPSASSQEAWTRRRSWMRIPISAFWRTAALDAVQHITGDVELLEIGDAQHCFAALDDPQYLDQQIQVRQAQVVVAITAWIGVQYEPYAARSPRMVGAADHSVRYSCPRVVLVQRDREP